MELNCARPTAIEPTMHVIFLDIDGVIDARRKINYVDSDKLALLVGIAQQTGSRIVISSHWRLVTPLHSSVRAVLRYYGLEVIGSTPVLTPWTPQRPLEILEWLQAYNSQAGALGRPHVTNYVAIDDRDLASEKGGERLTGHFVRTEIKTGLTEAHADEIAALFANADGAADVPGLPAPPERIIADSIPHGTFGEVRLTEAKATPSPTATASSTVAAPPVAAPLTAPLTGEAAVLDVASSGAGAAPLPAQPLAPLRSFTCEIAHTDIWTGYKLACGNGTGRKPRPWIVTTDAVVDRDRTQKSPTSSPSLQALTLTCALTLHRRLHTLTPHTSYTHLTLTLPPGGYRSVLQTCGFRIVLQ